MGTYKETSCFQTGLWADSLVKRPFAWLGTAAVLVVFEDVPFDFPDDTEETGDELVLDFRRLITSMAARDPMAPNADSALEEPLRDRAVAVPLASFSDSSVGSLLTNSLFSNWTTT